MAEQRGHEVNLASGVMFSPAQENKRMQRERIRLAIDLTLLHMQTLGVRVEYHKRPSMIHEFHFYKPDADEGEVMFARRSLDGGTIQRGGRKASCDMMKSVCDDEGLTFVWNDVPNTAEPQRNVIRDTVGRPPEAELEERRAPVATVPTPETPAPEGSAAELPAVLNDIALPFNADMTIRELRTWGSTNSAAVPADLTRKGDILEFLTNEYSNRS